jgi:hypothetical protein
MQEEVIKIPCIKKIEKFCLKYPIGTFFQDSKRNVYKIIPADKIQYTFSPNTQNKMLKKINKYPVINYF